MARTITQHWRAGLLVASIAGLLGAASWLWVGLQPREPDIAPYEALEAQTGDYQPGGSECSPAEVGRLPDREGARKRDSCADQAERHRLEQNDLVQQTRSADAAEEIVRLTYNQSLVLLLGTIFGGLTLCAAVAAAWYARHAASGAHGQLRHAEETAQKQLRAYVGVTQAAKEEFNNAVVYRFRIKNYGQTPAYKLTLTLWQGFGDSPDRAKDTLLAEDTGNNLMPGSDYTVDVEVTAEEQAELVAKTRLMWVHGEGTYLDAFGNKWPVRANYRFGRPPEK